MKILAAGDIHGDTTTAKKLAKKAEEEKVDLVVLAGDIVGDDEKLPGVISPFLEKKKKVLFVPGNHESLATADFIADFYGISKYVEILTVGTVLRGERYLRHFNLRPHR